MLLGNSQTHNFTLHTCDALFAHVHTNRHTRTYTLTLAFTCAVCKMHNISSASIQRRKFAGTHTHARAHAKCGNGTLNYRHNTGICTQDTHAHSTHTHICIHSTHNTHTQTFNIYLQLHHSQPAASTCSFATCNAQAFNRPTHTPKTHTQTHPLPQVVHRWWNTDPTYTYTHTHLRATKNTDKSSEKSHKKHAGTLARTHSNSQAHRAAALARRHPRKTNTHSHW